MPGSAVILGTVLFGVSLAAPEEQSRLELRVEPLESLDHLVRAGVGPGPILPEMAGLSAAVKEARAPQRIVGPPLNWGHLDACLEELRRRLVAAGASPKDPAYRNLWHTLFFVQSAATVRRFLDPTHVPYGEASGLYRRLSPVAELEVEVWGRHLAGELTREDALDQLVARGFKRRSR